MSGLTSRRVASARLVVAFRRKRPAPPPLTSKKYHVVRRLDRENVGAPRRRTPMGTRCSARIVDPFARGLV